MKVLALLLCIAAVNADYNRWNPVDVQSILCTAAKYSGDGAGGTGAPGQAVINIDIDETKPNERVPHIITFFRTWEKSGIIDFKAVDSSDPPKKVIFGKSSMIHKKTNTPVTELLQETLIAVPTDPICPANGPPCAGRRLAQQVADKKEEAKKEESVESELLEAEEDETELKEDLPWSVETESHDEEEHTEGSRALSSGKYNANRRSSSSRRSPPASRRSPPTAPRRRASPTRTPSKPSTGTTPASYTGARRRANPTTARRRGSPTPTGARRRINSPIGTPAKSNPMNPAAGNYGYASQPKINNNYPGGYSSSSYGYTGKNAHKKSSSGMPSKGLIMGAAVGGVLVGGGLMYAGSRWNRGGWGWNQQRGGRCFYDSWIHGCAAFPRAQCPSCTQAEMEVQCPIQTKWGPGQTQGDDGNCARCNDFANGRAISAGDGRRRRSYMANYASSRAVVECGSYVNQNAARDDLMGTGFIPADYTSPIVLTVYNIQGADFAPLDSICAPDGWNAETNDPAWTMKDPFPDIFLTVTPMLELEEPLGDDLTMANGAQAGGFTLGLLLAVLALNLRRLW